MTNIINRMQVKLTNEYFVSVIEFDNGVFEAIVLDSEYESDERFVEDGVKFSSQEEVSEFIENEIKPHYTGFVQTQYKGIDFNQIDKDIQKVATRYIKSGDSAEVALSKAQSLVEYYEHSYRVYK